MNDHSALSYRCVLLQGVCMRKFLTTTPYNNDNNSNNNKLFNLTKLCPNAVYMSFSIQIGAP
jgi:hypothetical protein